MKKGVEKHEESLFPVADGFDAKTKPAGRGCNPFGWLLGWKTQRNMDKFLKEHDKRTSVGEGRVAQPKR